MVSEVWKVEVSKTRPLSQSCEAAYSQMPLVALEQ